MITPLVNLDSVSPVPAAANLTNALWCAPLCIHQAVRISKTI